ncbi:MAG: cytochrome c family protein [Cellvibrionaceae bacterium]|nr:cytochrome c family protein [Motiliproteus sp.]MCW9052167.1 cytochrome c family protein [Motiliproteus sp.]
MKIRSHNLLAGVILPWLIAGGVASAQEASSQAHAKLTVTSPPEACQGCHENIFDEWKDSFHAKATTSPAFRGMFTLFDFSTQGQSVPECLNCHATDTKLSGDYEGMRQAILADEPNTRGVTCTACHAMRAVKDIPELLVPAQISPVKLPMHNVERSDLFKKEVMCSACHDYNNSHAAKGDWEKGVACCDTNRDFRKTEMAKQGVTCQTCHMAPGLEEDPSAWKKALTASTSLKDRLLRLVNLDRYAEKREWTGHRFPGSHDAEMVKTAVETDFRVQQSHDQIAIQVSLKNLIGHSIPNGCPPRARMFLRIWMEDEDGFEIDSHEVEYGFNFKDKDGFEPAMVEAAVSRGFDHVLEAESTDLVEVEFPIPEDEVPVITKASLTYTYFVMPPADAQNRMQQGLIRRIKAGTPEEKDFILNTEIPGRMAAMNRLASAYPPVLMWHAEQELEGR